MLPVPCTVGWCTTFSARPLTLCFQDQSIAGCHLSVAPAVSPLMSMTLLCISHVPCASDHRHREAGCLPE